MRKRPRAHATSATPTSAAEDRAHLARVRAQIRQLFLSNMTALGIPAVVAPGETLHIDWVNATELSPDAMLEIAGKAYLDWYMLTQARGPYQCHPNADLF